MNTELLNRYRGCMLGLACGDAVGTTLEFKKPGTFSPITDMMGDGPFELQRGQWTDDTSMALCMAKSLVERQAYDAKDIMSRFCRWHEEGYLSSTGTCFDIGITTRKALTRFQQTGIPYAGSTDAYSAGNGALMRLAPVPLFFYPDRDSMLEMAMDSTRLTHAAAECLDASQLFAAMLADALDGHDKDAILTRHGTDRLYSESLRPIAVGSYRHKEAHEIRGTGYVVKSLEAALWCFATTDSFEDAILQAANLGEDADTTAAICGQLAGAYYGESGIPKRWLDWLAMGNMIRELADDLFERGNGVHVVQGHIDQDGYPCAMTWPDRNLPRHEDLAPQQRDTVRASGAITGMSTTVMNLGSTQRVNEFLKDREFLVVFPPLEPPQQLALSNFYGRYGFGWKPLTIYIRFEPAEHGAGVILIKDGRKRSILNMDTSGFPCKIYPFGHGFDAATIPDVYRKLTGLEMKQVRFMTPDFRTFFSRGDDRKPREV